MCSFRYIEFEVQYEFKKEWTFKSEKVGKESGLETWVESHQHEDGNWYHGVDDIICCSVAKSGPSLCNPKLRLYKKIRRMWTGKVLI